MGSHAQPGQDPWFTLKNHHSLSEENLARRIVGSRDLDQNAGFTGQNGGKTIGQLRKNGALTSGKRLHNYGNDPF